MSLMTTLTPPLIEMSMPLVLAQSAPAPRARTSWEVAGCGVGTRCCGSSPAWRRAGRRMQRRWPVWDLSARAAEKPASPAGPAGSRRTGRPRRTAHGRDAGRSASPAPAHGSTSPAVASPSFASDLFASVVSPSIVPRDEIPVFFLAPSFGCLSWMKMDVLGLVGDVLTIVSSFCWLTSRSCLLDCALRSLSLLLDTAVDFPYFLPPPSLALLNFLQNFFWRFRDFFFLALTVSIPFDPTRVCRPPSEGWRRMLKIWRRNDLPSPALVAVTDGDPRRPPPLTSAPRLLSFPTPSERSSLLPSMSPSATGQ